MKGKYKIIPTSTFTRDVKNLNKRYRSLIYDLVLFEREISNNPDLGIDYGHGIRKARMAIKSKDKGKSGGARVITYKDVLLAKSDNVIYLVHIFDKSDKNSISKKEIFLLLKKNGLI